MTINEILGIIMVLAPLGVLIAIIIAVIIRTAKMIKKWGDELECQ